MSLENATRTVWKRIPNQLLGGRVLAGILLEKETIEGDEPSIKA
jgi:hypothetical protein